MGKVFDKSSFRAEISARKLFVKRDILIYASLVIFITILFSSLFFSRNNGAQGFKVEIDNATILTHVYGKDFAITAENILVEKDGDNYTVKILTENGFNLLLVNELERSVKMLDSDCPSKNCVHMHQITNAGAIYCAPRALKITPLDDEELIPPTIGGQS